MTRRKEQELLWQQASRRQLLRGEIDRRTFLTNSLVAGLGMAGVGVAAKYGIGNALAQDRPLTPTFYQWIIDLHPSVPQVNAQFPGINYQIAPVEGFGIERFVAEAKNKESTWDVYVGQTPFVEMSAMIEADVIEPWDPYMPKDVLDDIIPSIRAENTVDGKMYGWPFLLDVIGMGWHSGLTTQAGLPDVGPATWDEYLAAVKKLHSDDVAGNVLLLGGQDAHMSGDWVSRLMSMTKLSPTDDGILNEDNEPIFNDQGQGELAIERLKEVLPYCPQGVEGFDYPEGSSTMQQGKAAMLVTWSDVIVGIEDGPHNGQFGYTVAPSETYQQQEIGGWSIIVNAASNNLEEAYKFLAWMSEGRAYELFREGGESSLCLLSDINDPNITAAVPMMQSFKDFSLRGTTTVSLPFYRITSAVEAQRVVYEEVLAAVTGRKTPKEAMDTAYVRVNEVVNG
jgi:ABC-type glycerol-3-phosphate transport system substrate-binding protein